MSATEADFEKWQLYFRGDAAYAVAVPRQMFADILSLISRLRASPAPA